MECTKVNCPMQAGTKTDNCGESCPWRTTAKTGDMISRMAAIDAVLNDERIERNYGDVSPEGVIKVIESLPAVNAVPVVHARWKDNGNGTISCSRCATWFQKEREPYLLWCGYCGAKMDGEAR